MCAFMHVFTDHFDMVFAKKGFTFKGLHVNPPKLFLGTFGARQFSPLCCLFGPKVDGPGRPPTALHPSGTEGGGQPTFF